MRKHEILSNKLKRLEKDRNNYIKKGNNPEILERIEEDINDIVDEMRNEVEVFYLINGQTLTIDENLNNDDIYPLNSDIQGMDYSMNFLIRGINTVNKKYIDAARTIKRNHFYYVM